MVSSPMHFNNTILFLDRVEAMVNDVKITNEVNISEQPMHKLRDSIVCLKQLNSHYWIVVVTKLHYQIPSD